MNMSTISTEALLAELNRRLAMLSRFEAILRGMQPAPAVSAPAKPPRKGGRHIATREQLYALLEQHPNSTSAQIRRALGSTAGSVSALLSRGMRAGKVVRSAARPYTYRLA
jgi:hypothetical protein